MRTIVSLSTFAILSAVVLACSSAPDEPTGASENALTTSCGKGPTVSGIDVSSHQQAVDFAKVKQSGRSFSFVRATYGSIADDFFTTNFPASKRAGLVTGSYVAYYVQVEHRSPGEQAAALVAQLQRAGYDAKHDLPPAIDVESFSFDRAYDDGYFATIDAATASRELRAMVDDVTRRIGRKPLIYTSQSIWDERLLGPSFGDVPLWLAYYFNDGKRDACPIAPSKGTAKWTFWQYCKSDPGAGQCQETIPGLGRPDANVFNGTLQDLLKFAGAGSTLPAPPPGTGPASAWDCAKSASAGKQYGTCGDDGNVHKCDAAGHDTAGAHCAGLGCATFSVGQDDRCILASKNWSCADSQGTDGAQHWTCNDASTGHAGGDRSIYRCASGKPEYIKCTTACRNAGVNQEDECVD